MTARSGSQGRSNAIDPENRIPHPRTSFLIRQDFDAIDESIDFDAVANPLKVESVKSNRGGTSSWSTDFNKILRLSLGEVIEIRRKKPCRLARPQFGN